jgi:predicted nuclease of predicted toxin-antitoxin system
VRFLVDQSVSRKVASHLRDDSHDAIHVAEQRLERTDDVTILIKAAKEDRIVITADTDFGDLLALLPGRVALVSGAAAKPSALTLRLSVILLRRVPRRPADQALLIMANLPAVEQALATGAIVTFDAGQIRVRALPIRPAS